MTTSGGMFWQCEFCAGAAYECSRNQPWYGTIWGQPGEIGRGGYAVPHRHLQRCAGCAQNVSVQMHSTTAVMHELTLFLQVPFCSQQRDNCSVLCAAVVASNDHMILQSTEVYWVPYCRYTVRGDQPTKPRGPYSMQAGGKAAQKGSC